jgi:hypothetical protein
VSWLYTHRLLLVIYGFALTLAAFELTLPADRIGELESPAAYLEPGINVADVSAEIYPNRALTLYYLAYQASLCTGPPRSRPKGCELRDPVQPGQVRELIERSLATGNRSIEMAMYNHIVVLIQEGADQDEIERAVYKWRRSYPGTSLANPLDITPSNGSRRNR